MIGYCYSTLVYQFTVILCIAREVNGEDMMVASRLQLHTLAIWLAIEVSSQKKNAQ